MRILFLLLLTLGFSNDFYWEAITSLINPTDLHISNGLVYATTNGGVIQLDLVTKSFIEIGFDEGIWPLDLTSLYVDDDLLC